MAKPIATREMVVAGACEPIGLAVALAFSRVAAKVIAVDNALDDLESLRCVAPDALSTAAMDVRNPAAIRREFRFLTNWFIDVDVLINCAGVDAAATTSHEMALHLSELGEGDIITVAREPQECLAVEVLTARIAAQYGSYEIRCQAIAPSSPVFPSPESMAHLALQAVAPGEGMART